MGHFRRPVSSDWTACVPGPTETHRICSATMFCFLFFSWIRWVNVVTRKDNSITMSCFWNNEITESYYNTFIMDYSSNGILLLMSCTKTVQQYKPYRMFFTTLHTFCTHSLIINSYISFAHFANLSVWHTNCQKWFRCVANGRHGIQSRKLDVFTTTLIASENANSTHLSRFRLTFLPWVLCQLCK